MTEADTARACAEALYQRDPASQALGMTITHTAPGQASVAMVVREDMVNGHGSCHGGLIFALADSAFAFASNSYNQVNVALSCSIDYLAPGRLNDTLTATAEGRHRSRRTGLYEVSVRNQDGAEIARFRGRSYQQPTAVLADSEDTT